MFRIRSINERGHRWAFVQRSREWLEVAEITADMKSDQLLEIEEVTDNAMPDIILCRPENVELCRAILSDAPAQETPVDAPSVPNSAIERPEAIIPAPKPKAAKHGKRR